MAETDWEEVNRILEQLKDATWCEQMLALKGKIHLGYDIDELREDRDPFGRESGRISAMAKVETKKETDWGEVHRILDELKDADWYERMLALEGKIHFTIPLEELRKEED